jgi:pyruvate/2-oxoglutarate dehydrogenase complex dihydrolipoamide dehydrogenase (E3) component
MTELIVTGAGPAGMLAALRGADLGVRTVLVSRAEFGGMAANDGPVPVRTLAHTARLIRDARQLGQYGVAVSEPVLDYPRLLLGPTIPLGDHVNTSASFTDPEYAQTGLTEAKARETHDVVIAVVHFDSTTRTIIDGRKFGLCKLIADRKTARILGCHVVGERAVEIA